MNEKKNLIVYTSYAELFTVYLNEWGKVQVES